MNWIDARIKTSPERAVVVGKTVFLAGALLVVAALFGRIGMIRANAERLEGRLAPLEKLVELYPGYPTWPVPEGPVGYSVAAALILAGMYLVVRAGEARRQAGTRDSALW